MRKKTQLNIHVDDNLLKDLKYMALKKNIKLNELVNGILFEKLKLENSVEFTSGYSEKDAINFHNFMKLLFEKTTHKLGYSSREEAFKSLISFIEIFDKWNSSNTERLFALIFSGTKGL